MSSLADWLNILLWFGLKHFVPALDRGVMQTVGAIIALAAAIVTIFTV